MSKTRKDPAAWKNYDRSSLPQLLKHDTWPAYVGLSLLSGIDPKDSELFDAIYYYNLAYDETALFEAETRMDLSELKYWKIQLLADRPNGARRVCYADSDEYMEACLEWEKIRSDFPGSKEANKPLDELLAPYRTAEATLAALTDIFFSNPNHDKTFASSPDYYIAWANGKNLTIPWIKWAEARGYLEPPGQTDKYGPAELDKRERDTLDTLVGALLFALKLDPTSHGVVKQVVGFTEGYGAPIQKTTVGKILKRIRSAKESVQDRKRR